MSRTTKADIFIATGIRYVCWRRPNVYDLFHVVAKYGREVIDRVRVDEANRLRQDRPARKRSDLFPRASGSERGCLVAGLEVEGINDKIKVIK